jgi:hypothetical protein
MKTRCTRTHIVCAALLPWPASAQVLIDHELINQYTQQELVGLGIGNAQYDVEVYKLTYNTIDPFGQPTIASGAVVMPLSQACFHPIAAYMHGTILNREDVPSRLSGEIIVGYYLAATGYVGVLPDYLGLGDSPGMHPYIHSASEASASVDMLRAAREFCAQQGLALNGQIFLTGYSQGGHACMATHKLIQDEFLDEFSVTASAPCSGPYDVSGVQALVITSPDPYPAPYYLPYILLAYGYVYPGLYDDIAQVFKEPWATELPPLFMGNNGSGPVDAIMPNVPSQILTDSILNAYETDPDHPFRLALRDNDLYDWSPQAPVRMFYCEGDSHVSYQNSIVALQSFQANGAPQVNAQSAGASLDHGDCAFPALFSAKLWFDQLRTPCDFNSVREVGTRSFEVFPNPAQDQLWLVLPEAESGVAEWVLLAADGRDVAAGQVRWSDGRARLALEGLATGVYVLRLEAADGVRTARLVIER